MTHNIYIYILIMGGISYLIRVLPMTLIRKPLKNQFLQSFLYYVPYVTLAVMTFPAILHATQSPISGALALVVGVVAAWCGAGLLPVAVLCCLFQTTWLLYQSYRKMQPLFLYFYVRLFKEIVLNVRKLRKFVSPNEKGHRQ